MKDPTSDDQETARTAAQELDHEPAKEEVHANTDANSRRGSCASALEISTGNIGKHGGNRHLKKESQQTKDLEALKDDNTVPRAVKVPRSRRRGLFGRFTLLIEVEEPRHYPRRTKWFITFNIALAAVAAPLGSAIIFREPSC